MSVLPMSDAYKAAAAAGVGESTATSSAALSGKLSALASGLSSGGGAAPTHRIYIGNMHPALEEPQLRELLSAFGPVKELQFPRNSADGTGKGFAFVEFYDGSVTEQVIAGLNGLDVLGKQLKVTLAKVSQQAQQQMQQHQHSGLLGVAGGAAAGGASLLGGAGPGAGAGGDSFDIKTLAAQAAAGYSTAGSSSYYPPAAAAAAAAPSSAAAAGPMGAMLAARGTAPSSSSAAFPGAEAGAPQGIPSRVLLLEGMVAPEELMEDAEYRDICVDVTTECSKYGALAQVMIPRPPSPAAGRVFLHYHDLAVAVGAATSLSCRQFGGKYMQVRYYDEGSFRAGILTA